MSYQLYPKLNIFLSSTINLRAGSNQNHFEPVITQLELDQHRSTSSNQTHFKLGITQFQPYLVDNNFNHARSRQKLPTSTRPDSNKSEPSSNKDTATTHSNHTQFQVIASYYSQDDNMLDSNKSKLQPVQSGSDYSTCKL